MNRRGLALQAYLAYARGAPFATLPELPPRPRGPLLLACAQNDVAGRALASLCGRLRLSRPETGLVFAGRMPEVPGVPRLALPPDRLAETEALAAALRPDAVLWTGQHLAPALLHALRERALRMVAVDAADLPWTTPAPRWLPDLVLPSLTLFDSIHCRTEAAARRLRRLGLSGPALPVSGPLQDAGPALDCPEELHAEISGLLAGRPVWLAARLRAEEAGDVLRAHRRAVRLAHRLLLVIVPQSRADHEGVLRALGAESMRVSHWDSGEMPDENTQVLLAEGPDELGLWFRVAPLAFLGGSLVSGHGGSDPFEAASLGTGILYGPNVGQHLDAYTRLVDAGAARIVRDFESLAAAVSNLIAPDKAAAMAHAGWDVATAGATLVDTVIAELAAALDQAQSH